MERALASSAGRTSSGAQHDAQRAPVVSSPAIQAAGRIATNRIITDDKHKPHKLPPFPLAAFRSGNRFDGVSDLQWLDIISTPRAEGPSVVGPLAMKVAGVDVGHKSFFVWTEHGDIVKWMPVEQVPMGGSRHGEWIIWRSSAQLEVICDRVTDEATLRSAAPGLSAHDLTARRETAEELNRDLEHYVATGSPISRARAQVRGAHEDVLIEMVHGVTQIIGGMQGATSLAEEIGGAGEAAGRLLQRKLASGVGEAGHVAPRPARAKPYERTLRATPEQHTLASVPRAAELEPNPDNFAGMSRLSDVLHDGQIEPGLRARFLADASARLSGLGDATTELHRDLGKVAHDDPAAYLRQGHKLTESELEAFHGVQRAISMKSVLATLTTDAWYGRAVKAANGRLPDNRSEFK